MNQSYVRSPLSIDWSTRAVLYNVANIYTSPQMLWLAVCSQNMCTPLHQFCTIERSVKFCDTRSDLVESTHSNTRIGVCLLCVISPQSVTEVPGMPALYNGREMTLHCDVIALGWQRQVRVFNNKTYFQIIFIWILLNFVWILHWLFD